MERKLGHLLPYERRDKVSKISIEPEKPYGIYLPDWEGVVQALNTFSRSEYQSTAPIPRSHIIFETELRRRRNSPSAEYKAYTEEDLRDYVNFTGDAPYQQNIDRVLKATKDHFENGKFIDLDDKHGTRGSVQLSSNDGKSPFFIGGRSFYKTTMTIEALRSEKQNQNSDSKRYTAPYLLNIYSELNNENPEEVLLQAIPVEQAVLPRRVQVMLFPEAYIGINSGELTDRLNTSLHNKDKTKIDRLAVFAAFTQPKIGSSLGIYDGLELKMRSYDTRHLENPGQRHVGVEFIISDPTLESRVYKNSNIIPPEKRQAAQALVEKVATAFTS